MTSALGRFQEEFVQALFTGSSPAGGPLDGARAQPGFAVYRNTVLKGCIDALQANFPAVARLVGDPWFRAAADVYVRAEPPSDSRMLMYGATFPAFLAQFLPAAELPYLSAVALLDRFWIEAHVAENAEPLNPKLVAELSPEQFGCAVFNPHPAARWAWFAGQPIRSLWENNRSPDASGGALDLRWEDEGIVVSRPFAEVIWTPLEPGGIAFLNTCAAGGSAEAAVSAAVQAQPEADLAKLIAKLLDAGCLSSISILSSGSGEKVLP